MNIKAVVMHCPYWINRLKDGKVTLRGFANGKGEANEIREELERRLDYLPPNLKFNLTDEAIRKFARREKIGIDCSGFVYRVIDELLQLGYGDTKYKKLDEIFTGGINKTNVERLTSDEYSRRVSDMRNYKIGDVIRLWGGKHAAIIINNNKKEILYAHSSWLSTKIQGVHTSRIQIIDEGKTLEEQRWMEETRKGENFGQKYFNSEKGDGVFRLKIFN